MEALVVGLIGLVASFLSNISGGGGALIQLPALIAIGVSPITAIGTIKVGALGLVTGSVAGSNDRKVIRKDYLVPMMVIVALASIIGPRIVLSMPEESVKVISSVLICLSAILSLTTFRLAKSSRQTSVRSRNIGYVLYFIIMLALAGIGSGMGLIANYILIGFLGMSALETVATRRAAGLVGIPLQFMAFAIGGHINYALGFALLAGSLIGSFLGMRVAIEKGSGFIAKMMAVVSIALVISLFV